MGLNLAEGEDSKKVLLVNGSKCPLPTKRGAQRQSRQRASSQRPPSQHGVFGNLVESIDIRIGQHIIMAKLYNLQVDKLLVGEACEDDDDTREAKGGRGEIWGLLDETKEAVEALDELRDEATKS